MFVGSLKLINYKFVESNYKFCPVSALISYGPVFNIWYDVGKYLCHKFFTELASENEAMVVDIQLNISSLPVFVSELVMN
jgi:hypothetical protein